MKDFDLRKYLAEGRLLKENKIAQAIRDEAEQPYFKVGAAIFYDYADKIEKAEEKDYREILQSMERELIKTHPNTFDGDDDIVASFMALAENKLLKEEKTFNVYNDGGEPVLVNLDKATPSQEKLIRWEMPNITEPETSEEAQEIANEIMQLNSVEDVKQYYGDKRGWFNSSLKTLVGDAMVIYSNLAENKLLKEEIDVNKILSDGNYDEIDDEELLAKVRKQLPKELNLASLLNLLVMKIEDEEGGNIDFT